MTSFDDRQKSFENKFALDEELKFKINNRRNKLLGLWAAEKLGKSGADAEAYAKEVVISDFEEPGEEDMIAKILADFQKAGVALKKGDITYELNHLSEKAREQIMNG
jgi:hypothetical protein